jgi:hypothetical protein
MKLQSIMSSNLQMLFLMSLLLLLFTTPWEISGAQDDSSATNKTTSPNENISSEGCQTGYGYFKNDTNPSCYPIDSIGVPPPKDKVFCSALGCPYNPPALG